MEQAVVTKDHCATEKIVWTDESLPERQEVWRIFAGVNGDHQKDEEAVLETFRRLIAAYEGKDLDGLMSFYSPDYRDSNGYSTEYVRRAWLWWYQRTVMPYVVTTLGARPDGGAAPPRSTERYPETSVRPSTVATRDTRVAPRRASSSTARGSNRSSTVHGVPVTRDRVITDNPPMCASGRQATQRSRAGSTPRPSDVARAEAAGMQPADLRAVLALIESGALSLDGLITHRSAATEADAAYRTAFGDPACLKMVLDWRACS